MMRFTYLAELSGLKGLTQKVLEQQEFWALNAIIDYAQSDLDKAADLFGTSKNLFLERLRKHNLLSSGEELLPFLKESS